MLTQASEPYGIVILAGIRFTSIYVMMTATLCVNRIDVLTLIEWPTAIAIDWIEISWRI